jgi:hypothetical protein
MKRPVFLPNSCTAVTLKVKYVYAGYDGIRRSGGTVPLIVNFCTKLKRIAASSTGYFLLRAQPSLSTEEKAR